MTNLVSHYSRNLYICLKCYIGIWIYYFIHLFYKKVCVSVCARRSLNGCSAEQASQWSFSDRFHVELQTFMRTPRALFCCRSPPRFSQSQRKSHVRSWSPAASKNTIKSNENMYLDFKCFNSSCDHDLTSDSRRRLQCERDIQLPVPAG